MRRETYCLSCRKNTKNINLKIVKTKNNKLMMQSSCAIFNNKKFRFIRSQEAKLRKELH